MKKILFLGIILISIILTYIITIKTLKIDYVTEHVNTYEITINNNKYIYNK